VDTDTDKKPGADTGTVDQTPTTPGSEHAEGGPGAETGGGRGRPGNDDRPDDGHPETGPEAPQKDDGGVLDDGLLGLPQGLLQLVLTL
jgi:hypothetical protein